MSTHVPLASLGGLPPHPTRGGERARGARGRLFLWGGGVLVAAAIYLGGHAFWNWKHVLSASGGRFFLHRVVIPVPVYIQNDPRWTLDPLGPGLDTLGQAGCALTSAAMVIASYGVDTDPQRLNRFLSLTEGYTRQGWIFWEKAAALAPARVEMAYEDLPSYALIDNNLLAGNPVIIRLTLPNGTMHFVVVVGKSGWDYLIQDPARPPDYGVYPLRERASRIEALRFYHLLPGSPALTPLPVPPPEPLPPTPPPPVVPAL